MRFRDSAALVALLVHEVDTPARAAQLAKDSAATVWWAAEVECESAIQRRARSTRLMTPVAFLERFLELRHLLLGAQRA